MPAWVIHTLLQVLAWMPLPVNHGMGALLGGLLMLVPNRTREVAQRNLQLCFPDMDPNERRRLYRKAMIEAGKTATEFGPLWKASPERALRMVRSVEGAEAVDAARKAGRGGVLLAPHLGAWELVGLYCGKRWPLSSLYRPPRMQVFDSIIRAARERTGSALVPADTGGVRSLYKAMKEGRLIGILPDQQPKKGTGVFAPFFGQPAFTMILVNRLLAKSQLPAFFVVAERLSWGRGYALRFESADPAVGDRDVEKAAAVLNAGVEQCVRRNPAQYQWTYKRFGIQPDGRKLY
ncbi:MAG: lysophospholipid acyltransferase family protein [Chromatiales bacterium]|nr:lysophospholipid acyltransferase family protein [Chromatiales bacterium]